MEQLNERSYTGTTTPASILSKVMCRVYAKMFLALIVTACTALYVVSNEAVLTTLLGSRGLFLGLIIAELAVVFIIYELPSIAYTFFITAGVFGAMSIYGLITKNDMTKFGNYCIMALFGLIIASLVNIFMHSESLDWIISLVGVALFIGLTAWDTQKIKEASYNADPSQVGKLATIGALSLYLDFINLFLYLLRFFGKSRD